MKLIYILAALFLAGCASKPVAPPLGKPPTSNFFSDQAERKKVLSSVKGRLKLTYQGPKERVLGRGFVVARYPSAAKLELRDPFGKLHFQSTLWGKEFWAIYPESKTAYKDNRGGERYFQRTLGIGVGFDDLHALSLGILPSRIRPDGQARITIHPDYLTLEKLEWEQGQGTIIVKYGDFRPCCKPGEKHAVAQWMELTEGNSRVEIEWQELKSDEVSSEESFYNPSVGKDFKIVKLE